VSRSGNACGRAAAGYPRVGRSALAPALNLGIASQRSPNQEILFELVGLLRKFSAAAKDFGCALVT
jgi:hypothetical protein